MCVVSDLRGQKKASEPLEPQLQHMLVLGSLQEEQVLHPLPLHHRLPSLHVYLLHFPIQQRSFLQAGLLMGGFVLPSLQMTEIQL